MKSRDALQSIDPLFPPFPWNSERPLLEPLLLVGYLVQAYRIGLALETGVFNNQPKTLPSPTNSFLYPLAGCYTLASDTPAQRDFFQSNADLGTVLDLDSPSQWAQTITALNEDRDKLEEKRKKAWEIGHASLNWEVESKSLIEAVESILDS